MNRREAIAALVSLPAATRISVASLNPNDVIVIHCGRHLTLEGAARLKGHIQQIWPGHQVAILDPGLTLTIAEG